MNIYHKNAVRRFQTIYSEPSTKIINILHSSMMYNICTFKINEEILENKSRLLLTVFCV